MKKLDIQAKVKVAIQTTVGKPIELKETDSLIANLGFNSLKMVSLSLALEDQFGRPLLLNEWISQCEDPRALTVGSLYGFVHEILTEDM